MAWTWAWVSFMVNKWRKRLPPVEKGSKYSHTGSEIWGRFWRLKRISMQKKGGERHFTWKEGSEQWLNMGNQFLNLFIFQILSISCIAPHTMLVIDLKNISWWFRGLGCICTIPDCFVQTIKPWTGLWEEVISFYRPCGALYH